MKNSRLTKMDVYQRGKRGKSIMAACPSHLLQNGKYFVLLIFAFLAARKYFYVFICITFHDKTKVSFVLCGIKKKNIILKGLTRS